MRRISLIASALFAVLLFGCSPQSSTPEHKVAGASKLDLAVENCDYFQVEQITHNAKKNATVAAKFNPELVKAIKLGQNDIAELLVKRGADVQAEGDEEGPLDAAAGMGNLPMVKLLLKSGASVERTGAQPEAIHRAAQAGNLEILKLLLAQPEHPDLKDAMNPLNGQTPLHIAVQYGHEDIVRELLHRSVDVNRIAWQGTPLDIATNQGASQTIIDLLKKNGADRMSEIASDKSLDSPQFLSDHPDKSQTGP
jgi:ankyrin repeat protein